VVEPLLTRRKFLYTGAIAGAGFAALGADGFVQSKHIEIKKLEIPLARLPEAFDGFRLAQISDFHYEDHFSVFPIRESVQILNRLNPDLIVLTGDFITVPILDMHSNKARLAARNAAPCAEILRDLKAPLGKFAILGNHDVNAGATNVIGALRENGIAALVNRSLPLERGSARIWLTGVDDALDGKPDLGAAIEKLPSGETVVLLAHEPDFADEAALSPIDLQLSGHSHGGQIWFPFIGAPWLPPLARNYPRGLYNVGKLTLYTNLGIGTIRAPIRINCPPEVTLITLRAAKSKSS
jgi:predicted MPP superfamily phosphohydrolase